MPNAEILTIGTELLLGEIVDTNTQFLARRLRDAGIDLFWTGTVGDNEARIADAVKHALSRSQILLCTGGLGPTVDDVTREGIARALGVELVFHQELWQTLEQRFARFGRTPTENNKRQAYLPEGAVALNNAVGSAPGFVIEHDSRLIFTMPGVPSEMAHILENEIIPRIEKRFGKGAVIRARVLHIAGVPESQIDEKIADLEKLSNPSVGLAAHAGSVDVRLTAKADSAEQAAEMLTNLEEQVRQRLGDWIYGADDVTLARALLVELANRSQTLAVIEKGLDGSVVRSLTGHGNAFVGGEILNSTVSTPPLSELTKHYTRDVKARLYLGVDLRTIPEKHELEICILGLEREHTFSFSYGGHIKQASEWAASLALSVLRRELLKDRPHQPSAPERTA